MDKGKLTFDFVRAAQKVEATRLLTRTFRNYANEIAKSMDKILEKETFFAPHKRLPAAIGAFTSNGDLVGVVQCWPHPRFDEEWDIDWLVVDPDHQKQGIGYALMAQAEDFIRKVPLEKEEREIYLTDGTKLSNPLSRFYEKIGYTQTPDKDDVDDMIILTKKIFGAVRPPEEIRPSAFSKWFSNL